MSDSTTQNPIPQLILKEVVKDHYILHRGNTPLECPIAARVLIGHTNDIHGQRPVFDKELCNTNCALLYYERTDEQTYIYQACTQGGTHAVTVEPLPAEDPKSIVISGAKSRFQA